MSPRTAAAGSRTAEGTRIVKDLYPGAYPGPYDYKPRSLTRVGQSVLLVADVSDLWRSDGTETGTTLVTTFDAVNDYTLPQELTTLGNELMLAAYDASYGYELWRSDGTSAGTQVVKDIRPGTVSSDARVAAVATHSLYVDADGSVLESWSNYNYPSIWQSDGTETGTGFVYSPGHGTMYSWDAWTTIGDTLYFGNGSWYLEQLWKTDGTTSGTDLVKDDVDNYTNDVEVVGSRFFFAPSYAIGSLSELWVSDGTTAGTFQVKDIKPGDQSPSKPCELTKFGNTVLFTADDGTTGRELWRSDGTEAGTVRVKDILPGTASSNPRSLTVVNGSVFFVANDGSSGDDIWKTDGTEAGTVRVKDGSFSRFSTDYPQNLTAVGSTLFFTANDGRIGTELWKSDGTEAGTVPVKDIAPSYDSFPQNLTAVRTTVFFTAKSNGPNGPTELWKSDGTAAGTEVVKPGIWGNFVGHIPHDFEAVGDTLYFVADDGMTGIELWQSDGTDVGTRLVEDIYPGSGYSDPSDLVVYDNTLYFTADDGFHGRELWKIDGSGQSTRVMDIVDVAPDPRVSAIDSVDVTFSQAIDLTTLSFEDIVLERDDALIPMTTGVTVRHVAGSTYRIAGLQPFTDSYGRYLLGVRGSGIRDLTGQIVAGTATDAWEVRPLPMADILDVVPDPRNSAVSNITIVFSEAVTGFDLSDMGLTRDGVNVPLTGATVASTDNTTWTLGNLSGVTGVAGTYVLTLTAIGSGIQDAGGDPLGENATDAWVMDTTAPTAPAVTGITTDTGASVTDGVTSDRTLVLSGTAEANSTVTVFERGVNSGTATANGSAVWGFDYTGTMLAEGVYHFTAQATEAAGNTSDLSATFTLQIDTTSPSLTVAALTTNDATPTVTGTVSEGTLHVVVNGKTCAAGDGNLTVNGTAWTLQIPAGDALPLGTHQVVASATDTAGNVGSDGTTDELRIVKLIVTSLTPTASGFVARFSGPVDASVLNLYDSASLSLGPADVTLVGASEGPVPGSIVLGDANQQLTFVRTGGPLPADTYTATFRSAANGFREPGGELLDGNADGLTGDNHSTTFPVANPPAGTVTLRLPDFARGAGQPVNIPNAAAGLPIRISNADGVTSLAVDLVYDQDLLDITAASLAAGLPSEWTVVNPPDTSTPGVAKIRAFGTTPLSGTNVDVVRLTAVVPADALYGAVQAIRLENIALNDGAIPSVGDVAVHKAAYLGDADGSGIHSSADAFLTVQAALGLASGFAAHAWTDPRIVGDADGSGVLSAADAFLIVQEGLGLSEPFVPDNPQIGVTPVGGGVDPQFQIDFNLPANAGGMVTVPVRLDIEPAATNVGAMEFELFFDPARLTIDVPGGVSAGADTAGSWAIRSTAVAAGHLRVGMLSSRGQPLSPGLREIAQLRFYVDGGESSRTGCQPVLLCWTSGPSIRARGYAWTAVDGSVTIAAGGLGCSTGHGEQDLRSAVSAGSETRAERDVRVEPTQRKVREPLASTVRDRLFADLAAEWLPREGVLTDLAHDVASA